MTPHDAAVRAVAGALCVEPNGANCSAHRRMAEFALAVLAADPDVRAALVEVVVGVFLPRHDQTNVAALLVTQDACDAIDAILAALAPSEAS